MHRILENKIQRKKVEQKSPRAPVEKSPNKKREDARISPKSNHAGHMLCAKTLGGFRCRRFALSSASDLLLRNRPLSYAPPAPPPSPSPSPSPSGAAMAAARPKDESYLQLVIPKRIALFESIKARQLSQRQSVAGEPIKYVLDATSLNVHLHTRAVVWQAFVRPLFRESVC